jgi:hypothetical protein
VIAWLNPSAVVAMIAVAVPLVIHLLLRQRRRRIVVPSVRFIRRSDESSLRMRAPSDLVLLAVRSAIVALAALALLQPLILTAARRSMWAGRVARAVVVDTSDSVDAAASRVAADAESRDGVATRRFESSDPGRALRSAITWLSTAGPARRELVLLSDFQLGAVTSADVSEVPASMGIRAVRIASDTEKKHRAGEFTAGKVQHGELDFAVHVELAGADTRVTLTADSPSSQGLEVLTGEQRADAVETLMKTVRSAGAVSPSPGQPLVVRFRGSTSDDQREEAFSAWARAAAMRLLTSRVVGELNPRLTQRRGALVIDVDAAAESWQAAAALQAALNSRRDERDWTEREPLTLPDDQLRAWTRDAPAPAADGWRHGDDSDGRWFWLAALVLMGLEIFVRRSSARRSTVEDVRAA